MQTVTTMTNITSTPASTTPADNLRDIPMAVDNDFSYSDDGSVPSMSSEHAYVSTRHLGNDSLDKVKLEQMEIAINEERQVRIIRTVTLSFIVFAAITISLVVYFFAKNFDKYEFESEVSASLTYSLRLYLLVSLF